MTGSGEEGKAAKRRGRGFRRASVSARTQLGQAASRYGFAEADLLARWPEAAGEAFAEICRPVRVSYGRSRGLGATLTVAAAGPRALEVEMQAPLLIERVNAFYGYRAITKLSVTQIGPAAGFAEAQAAWDGPADDDDDVEARARAADMAARAASPALRAALERFGAYLFAHSRGDETPPPHQHRSATGARRGD